MTDAHEAIRKIEEIVEHWYQTGKLPEDHLLNVRKVARQADIEPITEHGALMPGGGMHIRAEGLERVYPLDQWIVDVQRQGAKVHRRRVLVVEDWTEVEQRP